MATSVTAEVERVIVTGAQGLIGSHVAKQFKANGVEVLELDLTTGHDLTRESFVREWFAGHPAPALVNAFALNDHVDAGKPSSRLMDISLESFERFIKVNVTTLFSVCREYARANTRGTIVNFSSVYGMVSPRPDFYGQDEKHVAYGVSKAAVIQLTRHLAAHLAPRIRVNCVAPGGIEHAQSETFRSRYGQQTPIGRMMSVDEVFGAVEFLVSPKASYCTGSVVIVDGGWTAW